MSISELEFDLTQKALNTQCPRCRGSTDIDGICGGCAREVGAQLVQEGNYLEREVTRLKKTHKEVERLAALQHQKACEISILRSALRQVLVDHQNISTGTKLVPETLGLVSNALAHKA